MLRVVSLVSFVLKKMSTLRFVSFVKPFASFVVNPLYEGKYMLNLRKVYGFRQNNSIRISLLELDQLQGFTH